MVKSYNILDNRKSLSYVFAVLLVMLAVTSIVILPSDLATSKKSRHLGGNFTTGSNDHSSGSSSKSKGLTQMPSEAADFPGKDPNAVQFRVLKAAKNSIGWYQINGEIINLSNKDLWYPKPIVRLFDKENGPIGTVTNGLVMTSQIPPHHSTTFEVSINPDDLLGKPVSYKISFTGTFQ
jgi:hypothetical protein